jgi:hypothetical protein
LKGRNQRCETGMPVPTRSLPGSLPSCLSHFTSLFPWQLMTYFHLKGSYCIAILISTSKNPCSFLLLLILSLQQN